MALETTKDLQSHDHKVLMDIIDGLRSKGVSRYIDLPQIVACGGQSSGKSSVLQAISGLSFPVGTNLTTTFATELVLRHTTETSEERCRVSIQSGKDHSEDQRKKLEAFGFSTTFDELDVGNAVDGARDAMALSDSKRFCDDVLRIEVSGPTQPHLTIVDLPGLFTAGNKDQSREEGQLVRSLVRSYMKNPRSIILAVVSAKSQFAEQSVTEYARELDRGRSRTLGLITKPDTLPAGSEMEDMYLKMARNEDVKFSLGWHVVVNRDYPDRTISNAERDEKEAAFLSSGIWDSLPQSHKGIAALRTRLSEVLRDHIIAQLPRVVTDIEDGIRDCTGRLERLGAARGTQEEQRKYLLNASHRFSSLIRSAVDGVYGDSFFGNAREDEGYHKRLRAVVQNTLEEFAQTMRKNGQAREIVDFYTEAPEIKVPQVERSEYLAEVRRLMKRTRGCELPGTYNPLIITELFHEQCQPWSGIVKECSTHITNAVDSSIDAILSQVVDEETKDRLWMGHIGETLERLKMALQTKNSELLNSHESAHPITYNHYLTETVQDIEARRYEKDLRRALSHTFCNSPNTTFNISMNQIVNALTAQRHADMGTFGAANAVDMSEAYYKVALKRIVDDVANLAVENCLISKLPGLFTPETVAELSDEDIGLLAAESQETMDERKALLAKLDVLSKGLAGLKRLTRHHPPADVGPQPSDDTSDTYYRSDEGEEEEEEVPSYSPSPSPRLIAVNHVRETVTPDIFPRSVSPTP
ncbi:hypothetical protein PG990_005928 [Apiospora arundinis]|uniref:P-loop containing nucleoside triphosphate hydrolase protein n=1 Tax=Apiospora arundinis TaxID=335852 RepID=A0ABR2J8S5_9PEZI